MLDRYKREISYLRISVTNACNYRCHYCVPSDCNQAPEPTVLTRTQIRSVVRAGARLGITKVRLTGGEPLMRKDIVGIVTDVKGYEGIEQVGMTTNGSLLTRYISELASAGLDSVNVSLDTLNPSRFRSITRNGDLEVVLRGIESAIDEGIPVKINTVVLPDTEEQDIETIRRFCAELSIDMQLIRQFSLSEPKDDDESYDRPPPCAECNRIRLLAHGVLKPCLHSDVEIPIGEKDLESCLVQAIRAKPRRGSVCNGRKMIEIGG